MHYVASTNSLVSSLTRDGLISQGLQNGYDRGGRKGNEERAQSARQHRWGARQKGFFGTTCRLSPINNDCCRQPFDTEMQSFFYLFTRYLAERAKGQEMWV